MKVVLIEPTGHNFAYGLNIGLGYLSSILLSKGHEVKVLDFHNRKCDQEKRLNDMLKCKPDVIGISIKSLTYDKSLEIIKYCKERLPNAFYIAGGTHVTLEGEKFLDDNKNLFNCCVIGEGEATIIELLDKLEKNINFDDVKGLIYIRKHEIIKTELRPFIKDLDSLPFPNYKIFDSVINGKLPIDAYCLMTSRGCPYECVFCASKFLWGRNFRARSPENVIKEIKNSVKDFKINKMVIWDDNFTLIKERAMKICDLIISEGLNLKWELANGIRADKVDKELLEKMKEAGCYSINIGIESGDPHVFENIKKGESLETIKKTVKLMKKMKFQTRAFFIIGLPDDDMASVQRSINFCKNLGIDANWYQEVPYPNTELYKWVEKNGKFLIDYKKGFQFGSRIHPPVVFETKNFSKEERLKSYFISNLRSKNYNYLRDPKDNSFLQLSNIIKIIWKYDRYNFPFYFYNLTKKILHSKLREFKRFFIKKDKND